MASKPVRFHPEAEQEYLSSLKWYDTRSKTAALDFEDEFRRAVSLIAQNPERWPRYLARYRRFVLRRFPFGLVHTDLQHEVYLLAVAHGHRRPGYWRKRVR